MPGVDPTGDIGSQPGIGQSAPSGTPSGGDVKPSGDQEVARANVLVALNHLEKQLPILGSDSDEGKALLSAISTLSKKFSGKKSEDLVPAELMQLLGSQPDAVKQQMMREMGGPTGPELGGPGPQGSGLKFA